MRRPRLRRHSDPDLSKTRNVLVAVNGTRFSRARKQLRHIIGEGPRYIKPGLTRHAAPRMKQGAAAMRRLVSSFALRDGPLRLAALAQTAPPDDAVVLTRSLASL